MKETTLQSYYELQEGLGMEVVTNRTTIEVTGDDRSSFLHNFCTNDVIGLSDGTGCEAFVTNAQGRIVAFISIFCHADCLILDSAPDQADPILAHLNRYLIREDVNLIDRSAETVQILLSGKKWPSVLGSTCEDRVLHHRLNHTRCTMGRREFHLRNVSWPMSPAFQIHCPAVDEPKAVEFLTELGAQLCASEATEIVRIEAGLPIYGRDISDRNLPQEVDRNELAIHLNQGCYLGQETVARIDALGHVNWLLKGIRFEHAPPPPPESELTLDGNTIARITSSVHSPLLDSPFALGYVRREHTVHGTHLVTSQDSIEILDLPLSHPNKTIPSS